MCGSEIADRAEVSMALLSHHWRVLTQAGIVTRTRRGQRQYCTLNHDILARAFEYLWAFRYRASLLPGVPPRECPDEDPLDEAMLENLNRKER